MFFNILKDNKGETYISFGITFYILIITFVGIMLAMPIFAKQQDLDSFAKTILRQAEIDGTVDQDDCYNYLSDMYHMTPLIEWEWEKYEGTKRVQLNKSIKVTLKSEFLFDVGGVLHQISIPLNAVAYGKSEVYWK